MKKKLAMLLCALTAAAGLGAGAAAEEKAELTMWIWDQAQLPGTEAAAAAFMEANPNVSIEVSCLADYTTKLPVVLGTDDCPDIMWMWGTATVDYIGSGMMEDLTPYIERDGYDTTQWLEGITKWYTLDDHLYAIPKDADGYAVYANKSLFEAAGVELPGYDWTWDDFAEIAKQLTVDGVYGFAGDGGSRTFSMASVCEGGDYYTEDGLTCTIANENTAAVWDMFKGLMDEGYSASNADLVEIKPENLFASGMAAMMIGGSWSIKEQLDALGDDLVLLSIPTGKAGKIIATHGIGYAMSSTCKNKEEAWQFMAYLGSEEAQLMIADVVIPANKAALEKYQEYQSIDVTNVLDPLPDSRMYEMSRKNATAADAAAGEYLAKFLAGEYPDAMTCLTEAQAKIQEAIDK